MLNFDEVIVAHIRWKNRLKEYIDGISKEKLVADDVGRDNVCTLGKWIYEQLDAHRTDPDFMSLKAEHAGFHRAAAEVVRCCDQGKRAEAAQMLEFGTRYALLSSSCVLIIKKIQQKFTSKAA